MRVPSPVVTGRNYGHVAVALLIALLLALFCAPRAAGAECSRAAPYREARTDSSALRLVVNAPAYRLDVFEHGVLTRSYGVAIGTPRYPTPRGSFTVSEVEWNPWWIPPPAEWARKDTVTPPGPANPMGRVKLYFQTLYFVHGTPAEKSIGTAASHGCVRMKNLDAIALARLVQRHAAPHITDADVDSLLAHYGRTRRVELAWPVPLEIRYDLVEVRGDSLFVYRDIYRLARGRTLAAAVSAAAAALGIEPGLIRTPPLRDAVRRSARGTAAVALSALSAP
ncbi:MAG: L,D-transpeptidase [Gemmatimonadaceae bacterium]|nr:L,D-transpeptidase [Gemmatimonadaceae bacterium]